MTAQIGVGGMVEVYRATDTNLGGQVAIKVLPEAFAQDADKLARFELVYRPGARRSVGGLYDAANESMRLPGLFPGQQLSPRPTKGDRQMHRLFGWVSVVVCLGLLLTACGSNEPLTSASPVAPTPFAPTAPVAPVVPNVTLSGVVTENGRPIESASVEVQWSCGGGCSAAIVEMTDAAGRYVVARPPNATGLPDGATVWVTAHKDGFVQQCAATAVMRAGVSFDLRLTSIASLSTAQPLSGAGSRTVSGTVFESTPAGRRPVADAAVSAYSEALYYADAVAFTRSDAAGRYWLCGLSEGRIPYLVAEKEGYNVSNVSVAPGTETTVDIQIRR